MSRGIKGWSAVFALLLGTAGVADARGARKARPLVQENSVAETVTQSPSFDEAPATNASRLVDPQILNQGEMLSLVKKYAVDMASAMLDSEQRREMAVRQRDAIKLACIQDRLSGMKLMKKLADNRLEATDRPSIRADELSLRHEFRGVEMAHERILQLRAELLECAGEDLQLTNQADGTQVPNTSVGSVDPGGTNIEVPPAERPVPASPYQ